MARPGGGPPSDALSRQDDCDRPGGTSPRRSHKGSRRHLLADATAPTCRHHAATATTVPAVAAIAAQQHRHFAAAAITAPPAADFTACKRPNVAVV